MIDVVFLLVVFFMLVSSFVEPRSIVLAQAGALDETKRRDEAAQVHIGGSGAITVDGQSVTLADLAGHLTSRPRHEQELTVRVSADQQVPLQRLVEVLDRLEAAGASNLTLTNQRGGPAARSSQ